MENNKKIIIGVIALIIAGIIIAMLMTSVSYERIEITPNGTSIEIPADQSKYQGNYDGIKIWKWDDGALISYNSHEKSDSAQLGGLGFNAINELIKKGKMESVDGITCYKLDADELLEIRLFDIIKVNYNGKFYFIPLSNETSHDNIIICSKNKDIALHMAKSAEYKNVYPDNTPLEDAKSTIDNMTKDLQSKANDYINNLSLEDAKSAIENKTGELASKNPISL